MKYSGVKATYTAVICAKKKKSKWIWRNDIPLIAKAVEQQQEGEQWHNGRLYNQHRSSDIMMTEWRIEDWWDEMLYALDGPEIYSNMWAQNLA